MQGRKKDDMRCGVEAGGQSWHYAGTVAYCSAGIHLFWRRRIYNNTSKDEDEVCVCLALGALQHMARTAPWASIRPTTL